MIAEAQQRAEEREPDRGPHLALRRPLEHDVERARRGRRRRANRSRSRRRVATGRGRDPSRRARASPGSATGRARARTASVALVDVHAHLRVAVVHDVDDGAGAASGARRRARGRRRRSTGVAAVPDASTSRSIEKPTSFPRAVVSTCAPAPRLDRAAARRHRRGPSVACAAATAPVTRTGDRVDRRSRRGRCGIRCRPRPCSPAA